MDDNEIILCRDPVTGGVYYIVFSNYGRVMDIDQMDYTARNFRDAMEFDRNSILHEWHLDCVIFGKRRSGTICYLSDIWAD